MSIMAKLSPQTDTFGHGAAAVTMCASMPFIAHSEDQQCTKFERANALYSHARYRDSPQCIICHVEREFANCMVDGIL